MRRLVVLCVEPAAAEDELQTNLEAISGLLSDEVAGCTEESGSFSPNPPLGTRKQTRCPGNDSYLDVQVAVVSPGALDQSEEACGTSPWLSLQAIAELAAARRRAVSALSLPDEIRASVADELAAQAAVKLHRLADSLATQSWEPDGQTDSHPNALDLCWLGRLPDPEGRPGIGVAALHQALLRLQAPGCGAVVSATSEARGVALTWSRLLGILPCSDCSEVGYPARSVPCADCS